MDSRLGITPAAFKYWVTTLEPGARLVLTHGLTLSPLATAFFASSPAPSMTYGFEVLVHDVIAAITTDPCPTSKFAPSSEVFTRVVRSSGLAGAGAPLPLFLATATISPRFLAKPAPTSLSATLSCGRR